MCARTLTEKTGELVTLSAVHDERLDMLTKRAERIEKDGISQKDAHNETDRRLTAELRDPCDSFQKQLAEIDKSLAVTARDGERNEKRLEDLLSRRWELGNLCSPPCWARS